MWSHDGARIAYSAGHLGDTIYEKAASGGRRAGAVKEPGLRHFPTSWSRDGRSCSITPRTLRTRDMTCGHCRSATANHICCSARPSMSGLASFPPTCVGWRTYPSSLGLRVRSMSVRSECQDRHGQPSVGEVKWQVSKDHGNWPQWRLDREIVFNTAPTGTALFAAPVNTNGTVFESGVPQLLPFPPNRGVTSTPQSTPDGQRFLIEVSPAPRAARPSISVVLNWPALLKQ